jgi:tetratricopeptide (TPR) repeat protein
MSGRVATILLLLGLVVASPAAATTPALRRGLMQVERLLVTWQIDEAEQALAPLARQAPDLPRVLRLRAEVLFHRGAYAEALKIAREGARRARTDLRIKALRNLIGSTADVVKGYAEHRTAGGHFRLFAPKGKDELLFPFAEQTLEAMYKRVQQELGYAPRDPIRVEIYPGPEALAQVSPLTIEEIERSGTIALCKYNRLMIVTPRALPRGYTWLDTLGHEYLHLIISRISHNSVPIWLHEGLAKYYEAGWRLPAGTPPPLAPTQEHLLAEALRASRLIRWEQMHPSMAKLPDQRSTALAFAEVQTAIDFIVRTAGAGALRKMIDALRVGKTDWQALQAATGYERTLFDQAWRKHLRGLNLRRLTGLVPPELRFGKTPTREQRIAAVKEGRARKLLRLAELLRSRSLTLAAIIEYQKARTLLGPRDELVANHLARAYLEVSSPVQAIGALLPVVEYYPEFPGSQVTLGTAYLRSGDLRAAERHLKIALRINPFDPEIHCGLARALKSSSAEDASLHARLCSKAE